MLLTVAKMLHSRARNYEHSLRRYNTVNIVMLTGEKDNRAEIEIREIFRENAPGNKINLKKSKIMY